MVSDLWRLREAIDRGTIKGLYYGDLKTDLVEPFKNIEQGIAAVRRLSPAPTPPDSE